MKKKMVSLLMAALMTVGMLAGCGGNTNEPASADTDKSSEPQKVTEPLAPETEAPSEAPTAEPVTLNVAYMPNYGSLWSIENAIAQGYFEEEGITVNLTQFQDGRRSSHPWSREALTLVISDRGLINSASAVRQLFLHYLISPTETR